ncbi:hypothetical protein DM860_008109 [Cuscuta australis]|uniref:Uncharacterized protein n=1 Tax=Cuscuta australis TaxID=267555 RepID=A0A328D6J8_9ASTE|nr:hypothetical protein DM860_008109 [Cuscuta australis]
MVNLAGILECSGHKDTKSIQVQGEVKISFTPHYSQCFTLKFERLQLIHGGFYFFRNHQASSSSSPFQKATGSWRDITAAFLPQSSRLNGSPGLSLGFGSMGFRRRPVTSSLSW